MDIIEFREYCLSLPLTEETTPFDETTLVYKVDGKMFALGNMEDFRQIAVKCDPDRAIELREQYCDVVPAFHFNKKHWNGINPTGDLPENKIKEWIHDSYILIVNKMSKKKRDYILQLQK